MTSTARHTQRASTTGSATTLSTIVNVITATRRNMGSVRRSVTMTSTARHTQRASTTGSATTLSMIANVITAMRRSTGSARRRSVFRKCYDSFDDCKCDYGYEKKHGKCAEEE